VQSFFNPERHQLPAPQIEAAKSKRAMRQNPDFAASLS